MHTMIATLSKIADLEEEDCLSMTTPKIGEYGTDGSDPFCITEQRHAHPVHVLTFRTHEQFTDQFFAQAGNGEFNSSHANPLEYDCPRSTGIA